MRCFVPLLIFVLVTTLPSIAREQHSFRIDDAFVQIQIDGRGSIPTKNLLDWTETTAKTISSYFGGFPVRNLDLYISFGPGNNLHGRTYGSPRPAIYLQIGNRVSARKMREHWILAHEMAHLAFPNVSGHRWLEEGMATYLEPIIRARAGLLDKDKYWSDLAWGLPQGQARSQDRGLAYDSSWGRTYWGGALFWFIVDLDLRVRSGNRISVQRVFRGILSRGGNIRSHWSLSDIIRTGDRSTGYDTMNSQAQDFVYSPGRVDLKYLWQQLGVDVRSSRTRYFPGQWKSIRRDMSNG